MRRPAVVVAVVVGAALVAILALSLRTTSLAFTIGVNVAGPVATLQRGDQACQRPIDVPAHAAFDRIMFSVGTFGRKGPPLAVTVRDVRGSTLSSGMLPAGYPDIGQQQSHTVRLSRPAGEGRVAVCIRNEGPRRVAIYGNVDAAARTSTADTNGRRLGYDLALVFERDRRSKLSLVPDMLERASLFRFPWMGAWTYVILLVALVGGGPLLIVHALRSAR
jgi:hypothetical protein